MGNTTHKLEQKWQAKFKEEWRRRVLYDPNLSFKDKAVGVAALIDYNREDPRKVGTMFRGQESLAELMGSTRKAVGDSLRALAKAGYLVKVGRTSNGRGSIIYRFELPDEVGWVETEQLVGENRTSGVQKTTHEQVEVTNKTDQRDSTYISTLQANVRDLSFNDPHVDPQTGEVDWVAKDYQGRDNGSWEFGNDPVPIDFFTETEEPQRRDEFIDYWSAVATTHDNPHPYTTVHDLFVQDMGDSNRSNWGGTFMSAMKTYLDPSGISLDEEYEHGLTFPEELEELPNPTFSVKDLKEAWTGHDDRPQEFRKVWERALLAGHEPVQIIAVGASQHASMKYPRELLDVLNGIKKIDRSRAVAAYRKATDGKASANK